MGHVLLPLYPRHTDTAFLLSPYRKVESETLYEAVRTPRTLHDTKPRRFAHAQAKRRLWHEQVYTYVETRQVAD